MVVGHGVESALVDPAGVISVDHLAHQPELGLHFVCHMPERLHEIKIQHIGGVQPYAVNVKLADPEADYVADIVPYRRISLVQLYQQVISPPVLIGKTSLYSLFPQKFTLQYQSLYGEFSRFC